MLNKTENKTPYFIFKPKILEKNYKEFEELCENYLGKEKYVIAYSVKTNSYNRVIEILNSLGSNFEIASLNEIELICKFTDKFKLIKNKLVVFNGPCKTQEELKIAIENRFLINADSKSEIDKIVRILNWDKFDIGLRVSLEESKFGFMFEEIEDIIDYYKKKNLNISCLSFHQGTQLSIRDFENSLNKIEALISKINLNNKLKNLKYIDLGGGFPDKLQMKNLGVSLENYFKLIERYMKKFIDKFNLKIILEPGRTLVSDAFDLIAKVQVIKQNFGRNYAILDVGINILSKIALSNYKFSKLDDSERDRGNIKQVSGSYRAEKEQSSKGRNLLVINKETDKKEYILAGPLLFKNDILGKFFGSLKEGDLIKIENVGAYCYNLAWEIGYKKPEIFNGNA